MAITASLHSLSSLSWFESRNDQDHLGCSVVTAGLGCVLAFGVVCTSIRLHKSTFSCDFSPTGSPCERVHFSNTLEVTSKDYSSRRLICIIVLLVVIFESISRNSQSRGNWLYFMYEPQAKVELFCVLPWRSLGHLQSLEFFKVI